MNFNAIEFYASYGVSSQLPPSDRAEIVFSGRSNVGKSSLINKVANRKRLARVSASPGKTVTINFFTAGPGYIVDLPGYGYAKVSRSEKERWAKLMEDYFHSDRDIRLVVQLVDIRHQPTADDLQMIDFLIDSEIPFLIALTKADKLTAKQKEKRLEELREEIPCGDQLHLVATSAQTFEGIPELRGILEALLEEDDGEDTEEECEGEE
ncbi:ribosome biogenesis GTP-binding protein YihA/YsxC [Acetanaerobacterium sp. MSJ-12]|uniref:Probable GTP-binding protein EngB n=1 Tax=Bittarella massiliensis (ex Durand et al. 2017) TaxID=1720313 RepID=A0AAW5KG88_9FIRM|nr:MULTISPECIES: ribosome biogenesis GTP-binding protein YihA/YsxC [Oscillospiraceae]MBC2870609.1 YihA family ribosome biogenesis GTP-binding protein [Bittarella massiliensis (ex Durand et al. 2017)]MBU5419438.1 ribosome biogenesis GTP-binding protein YihA/YsxC [Acetanaerobacterium sp. MSJ-12]MCQ4948964.1 ribosome biogenesis GTP-binding protein YihA/YsxC [Bittarella massiliensis (ex Durand et al. 2017)]